MSLRSYEAHYAHGYLLKPWSKTREYSFFRIPIELKVCQNSPGTKCGRRTLPALDEYFDTRPLVYDCALTHGFVKGPMICATR